MSGTNAVAIEYKIKLKTIEVLSSLQMVLLSVSSKPKFLTLMTTILITGGTGLIGKALKEQFIEHGYKVIILTRNPAAYNNPKEENVRWLEWDPASGKI